MGAAWPLRVTKWVEFVKEFLNTNNERKHFALPVQANSQSFSKVHCEFTNAARQSSLTCPQLSLVWWSCLK